MAMMSRTNGATLLDARGNPIRGARRLRQVLNDLGREKLAGLAGLQFDDDRDVHKVAGYPPKYTFAEGWDRYKEQDIARRIVDKPVETTWRRMPQIVTDGGEPGEGEWAEMWDEKADDVDLIPAFKRSDRLASIGEFSIIFLGFDDVSTDRELKTAVNTSGEVDLVHVEPYKQKDVSIESWIDDPSTSRHRMPKKYKINFGGDGKGSTSGSSEVVHWSRVLHIVEDPLDSRVYGLPRLQPHLHRLIDLEKIVAATGEGYWHAGAPILSVSLAEGAELPDEVDGEDPMDALDDDLKELIHGLRRHFMAEGIELKYLTTETPNPSDAADLMLKLHAATAGIPKRILFGSETGERASTEDQKHYHGTIRQRQNTYAEPAMIRAWTDRMIEMGVFEAPAGGYDVHWPELGEEPETEKAEKNASRAQAAKALTPVGGDPREIIEITEDGDIVLSKEKLERIVRVEEPPDPGPPTGEEAAAV